MRNLNQLERFRDRDWELRAHGVNGNSECGAFQVPSIVDGLALRIIASSGGGWDHVSVSRADRVPNYEEMEQIAGLFFQGHETAVQYHVPAQDHVNIHPHCLHWWRPTFAGLPRPPRSMVG